MLGLLRFSVTALVAGVLLHLASAASASAKEIYGLHEQVHIAELGVKLQAKLDTGAYTSSISATEIHEFTKNDARWVRFRLLYPEAPDQLFELPLVRTSKIKRRASDFDPQVHANTYSKRPVVELDVSLGGQTRRIEVSLADRSAFRFPFLLGAKALRKFKAVVDPALTISKQP